MKINYLFLLMFFTASIYAKEIELKNLLVITPDMPSNEIKDLLEKMPDNTLVEWRTGNFKFDTLTLEKKSNIRIDATNVMLTLNKLTLSQCNVMRIKNISLVNTDDTGTVTIKDSSDIALMDGQITSKDKKSGGIYISDSKNIYIAYITTKQMDEINLIYAIKSTLLIKKCKFEKHQGKNASLYFSNSNVEVTDSNFSTENETIIGAEKSHGLIHNSRFTSVKPLTSNFLNIMDKSHFTIVNNTFSNFFSVLDIGSFSMAEISNNKITDGIYGIRVKESSKAVIAKNRFLNMNQGDILVSDNSYSEIMDNILEKAGVGIYGGDSRMIIVNNRLIDIHIGIISTIRNNPYMTISLKDNYFKSVKELYNGWNKAEIISITDYDKFENYFQSEISHSIPVKTEPIDLRYKEVNLTNLNTLKNSKFDPTTANYLNPQFCTGKLVDDLIAGDTVIDAGEFVKIDKLTKVILYPKEYKGIKLDELPKLQSADSQYILTASVTTEGKLSDVHFMLTTADTLKFIKYKGKKEIQFKQKSNPDTGEEKYLFSLRLKNSDKQRSLSFITLDGKEVIKKFIFNDGAFKLIENDHQKADF